ncbi:MAG TPA: hypothetical protein VD883_03605, partial [Candidatus Omnitrophota bacterium]|nr:hypothetical protein [Candidatus Omnitrophota bacterium]
NLLLYQVHRGFGARGLQDSQRVYCLTDRERELKRRAILSFRSQTAYRRRFLLSFAASFERFQEVLDPALKRLDFAGRHGQY